jgi:hypothetical protein
MLTEESDSQQRKQLSLKTGTDEGIVTNLNSITTDSTDLFSQRLSEEINLIPEGSHSLLIMKWEGPIVDTHSMRPPITIIRG